MRTDHKVLVIAFDPMLAALVGALVERTGMQAAFPEPGEIADTALARVRPIAAILVDAMTSEAESELFLARANRKRIPILMFGPARTMSTRTVWLEQNAIRGYTLPDEVERLRLALAEIAGVKRAPRIGSDRRRPYTEKAADGALLLVDDTGQTWTVYDRRSGTGDRRRTRREFVNEAGDMRSCEVLAAELGSNSVETLLAQLLRAK